MTYMGSPGLYVTHACSPFDCDIRHVTYASSHQNSEHLSSDTPASA